MSIFWSDSSPDGETLNWGPLAVLQPLLDKMKVADIIDQHVPPDPQLEYAHGRVLQLLLAARLSHPVALMNVASWAQQSGADIFYDIPADKLNDDRLGRALDALFSQRHSILASVAHHVLRTFSLSSDRLHYDTTAILFEGVYDNAKAIADDLRLPPITASADFPPAHITHGYLDKRKMIHLGLTSVVDELGAVPIFGHTLSGNRNGVTGIAQQFQLLRHYLRPEPFLMVSDRGTFSAEHVARMHATGHSVLCSVSWKDYRPLFEAHRQRLTWRKASFLSVEQRRRRQSRSTLPREHYELAVLNHTLADPHTKDDIPCRVLFVFSSADEKAHKVNRAAAIAKIRAGLEKIQAAVARAHPTTKLERLPARIAKLYGKKEAGRYFRWELVPLSDAERAALPPRRKGDGIPSHRFVFHFDAQAAEADAANDGYYALLTTASATYSADTLFTYFKEQNYVEQVHHQLKTPLAIAPIFLKTPQRVEALAYLLKIALTAYHLIQRIYRRNVAADAKVPASEKRLTSESILRAFHLYPVLLEPTPLGKLMRVGRLTNRQRLLLRRLGFTTPAQNFSRQLPPHPPPEQLPS